MRHNLSSKAPEDLVNSLGIKTHNLEISELRVLIERLEDLFVEKVEEKKAFYEKELSELSSLTSRPSRSSPPERVFDARSRVLPKYRSKKRPSLTWSGRGSIPKWLLSEMRESKLKKESFRIAE